jgi:sporulation protein YlmC with PRC-barrel domain
MNKSLLSLAAIGVLALSAPAVAQAPAPAAAPAAPAAATPAAPAAKAAEPAKAKPVAIPANTFFRGQAVNQYFAKGRLIGAKVTNKAGENIGDIEDVIIANSKGSHDVIGVIMGVGGFLGVGEKKVGVQLGALKFKDGKYNMDVSKEALAAIPAYTYGEAPKTLAQKAGDAAKKAGEATKEAAKKAAEATKGAVEKAKEAVKPKTP